MGAAGPGHRPARRGPARPAADSRCARTIRSCGWAARATASSASTSATRCTRAPCPPDLPPPPDLTADGALADASGRIYVCTDSGVQMLTPGRRPLPLAGVHRPRRHGQQRVQSERPVHRHARPLLDRHAGRPDGARPATAHAGSRRQAAQAGAGKRGRPARRRRQRSSFRPAGTSCASISPCCRGSTRASRASAPGWRASATRPGAWTADNFRDIGALPHGDYVLHIEARDYAGNLSTPILLPITVQPYAWQRPWARLLLAALALGVVYVLLRWRTLALRRRQHALEQRIDARTRSLNRPIGNCWNCRDATRSPACSTAAG